MVGLSHLPAVISSGSSAPAALRSWAMPTLGECPLNPSPRPAILVAALVLLEIWRGDSPKTLASSGDHRLLRPDGQQGVRGRRAQVEHRPLCSLVGLGPQHVQPA